MARGAKRGASRQSGPARKPLPGWAWLLAGLSIGLFATLLVWLGGGRKAETAAVQAPPVAEAPAAQQPKNVEAPPPGRSRYDFYTLLPELEVVVPDSATGPSAGEVPPRKVEEAGEYILQAGSFRRFEDADRLKATLALQGIVANIQTVRINDDTWHRVRIGPYRDLAELNRLRAQLHANDIPTLLMKSPG